MLLLSLFVALVSFAACTESDNFSSDTSLKISFSTDTVRFEKALSTVETATKTFIIRNTNNKSLTISSVELMNPAESGFRIRVDNENGIKFADIDVLKHDSVFVFVDITAKKDCPPIIRDSIRFITNGNTQYVHLEAIGQDIHIWKGKRISKDTTLTSAKPFLIYDSLIVDKNAKLRIEKGTAFYFHHNARMHIYGSIDAMGSPSERIVFRGDRFDNIDGDIPYDNVPGRWYGIVFSGESYGNRLENVVIKNTMDGVLFEPADPKTEKAVLVNTIIQNSYGYGLRAFNSNIVFANGLFANTGNATVSLTGGTYIFTHCTIANYFIWKSRQSKALELKNSDGGKDFPLNKCDILNSLIYGSFKDELSLNFKQNFQSEYRFANCLIASPQKEDYHFSNTIWGSDPAFLDINYKGRYEYNFRLREKSPAINRADRQLSLPYPYDLDGNTRNLDSNPDVGCYEWNPD